MKWNNSTIDFPKSRADSTIDFPSAGLNDAYCSLLRESLTTEKMNMYPRFTWIHMNIDPRFTWIHNIVALLKI